MLYKRSTSIPPIAKKVIDYCTGRVCGNIVRMSHMITAEYWYWWWYFNKTYTTNVCKHESTM